MSSVMVFEVLKEEMRLLHPRRWLRKGKVFFLNLPFRFRCKVMHVKCVIGEGTRLYGCHVLSKVNGEIIIGRNCTVRHCIFSFYGESGRIILEDWVTINAHSYARSGLYVKDGRTITVGEGSLISNLVEISTTDWHVIEKEGIRTNQDCDVHIGQRVWICRRVIIGKGVSVGDGNVIGAGSIVTHSFEEKDTLIAGNPAVIKKRGIHWR